MIRVTPFFDSHYNMKDTENITREGSAKRTVFVGGSDGTLAWLSKRRSRWPAVPYEWSACCTSSAAVSRHCSPVMLDTITGSRSSTRRSSLIVSVARSVTHTHTCRPVDGTSMNEECEAIMVDRQVCAMRFLTWEDVAPRRPTSPTKHTQNPMARKIRDDWWVRPSHGECCGHL